MPDLDLLARLEAAAVQAWPARITRHTEGGWLLRATPGLDRGRSNNALTPCRPIGQHEIDPALEQVRTFAQEHAIVPGIQVSPTFLHAGLQAELDRQGWSTNWPTVVLTGPVPHPTEHSGRSLTVADHASPEWLVAWAQCEPGRDVRSHADTVFELLRGRARFGRIGSEAVGIAVEAEGVVGTFCVAVDPARRRERLGTAIVEGLLATSQAELAYLQVEERNRPALALYERLGFSESYRYCHRTLAG